MAIKTKLALLRRWMRILTGKSAVAIHQGPGTQYSTQQINGYYNDLTGKISSGTLLDENGIPLTQLADNSLVYFPIAIFQYGLGLYDLYLCDKTAERLEKIRAIADWAMSTQREDGSWDSFSPIRSKKYTVSSMCQGEGASFLFRAHKVLGVPAFQAGAYKAIDYMLLSVTNGGTSIYDNEDLYLEEYPQTPQRSVLNGWIFSLFGLYDAALLKPEQYRSLFDRSVMTLSKCLSCYDNGYWSMYDLRGVIASPAYHDVHISLLQTLYDLTGIDSFEKIAARFKEYQKKPSNRLRALIVKIYQKMTEEPDTIALQ